MSDCLFPAKNKTRDFPIYQQGFSLLEMVLVLLIMGMVASLSVVFIDNEDGQLRYEESIQKLEAMHKATVNVKEYKADFLFSGFVVDNGVLPTSANNYISLPPGWTNRQPFNNTTKPQCRIKESESYVGLDINGSLYKGYRNGYITAGADSDGNYKTGWGFDFTVSKVVVNNNLNLSYDETLNPETYSHPVNKDVPADNWGVALSEINITIENQTSNDIEDTSAPFTDKILITLTVFKNIQTDLTDTDKSNDSVWKTYHYSKYCSVGVKTSIYINDGDVFSEPGLWQTEKTLLSAETNQTSCPHLDNVDNTLAMNLRIPAGKHIVSVWVDGNDDGKFERKDNNSDGDYTDSGEFDELKKTQQLIVIPRYTLLPVPLIIND